MPAPLALARRLSPRPSWPIRLWFTVLWLGFALILAASAARAQPAFPALTGRVVDAANVIPADEKVRLESKLAALEQQTGRQLVVATLPDLQGYDIADYGYQLGRAWKIGEKGKNTGAILIVAPNQRKVRIEVGYGLEGIITDGLSSVIIREQIVPKFKAGDMPGGIEAGVDALVLQLALPPEEAAQRAKSADSAAAQQKSQSSGSPFPFFFIVLIVLFIVLPAMRSAFRGRRAYRDQDSGLGTLILFNVLEEMSRGGRSGGGSSWGGGGGWGGGGDGGGFSGGGGDFGGGGASGDW